VSAEIGGASPEEVSEVGQVRACINRVAGRVERERMITGHHIVLENRIPVDAYSILLNAHGRGAM